MQIANLQHQATLPAHLGRPSPAVAGPGASVKKPSFLIKDILASNSRTSDSTDPNPNTSISPSAISECSLTLSPYHLYPAFQACFGTPHGASLCLPRPGFSLNMDAILEQNERSFSLPIPLPVYVRTRSPTGEGLSKPKKCRRSRTVFTELQLMGLETKFENQKYLSTPDRIQLAETLGLTQIQVKTWYQNRRMKWKKQVLQKGGTEPPTKPKGRPKKNCFLYPEKFSEGRPVIEEIDLSETPSYKES